jgi:UDP-glucose 4-epimerase
MTPTSRSNEFLYRRAEIEDVVNAHLLALEKVHAIGFGRYIVSATTSFTRDDLQELRIDRVYVNERARSELGWRPRYDFAHIIDRVHAGEDPRSPLARAIGSKGYHADAFAEGPYPLE